MENITPQKYFEKRYGPGSAALAALGKRRQDICGMPKQLLADSSQDFCNKIAAYVKTLLTDSECNIVGEFYFGLTKEHQLSSSIEKVGDSYLVVVHRRLFNALDFLAHILCSFTITDAERWRIMADYLYKVSTATVLPVSLPEAPEYVIEHETIGAAMVNTGLVRYLLSHELFHVLPIPETPRIDYKGILGKYEDTITADNWKEELMADIHGALLPLRERNVDSILAEAHNRICLSSPILFNFFLNTIEIIRKNNGAMVCPYEHDHPGGSLRAFVLRDYFVKAFPRYSADIENNFFQTERNFRMVLKQIF